MTLESEYLLAVEKLERYIVAQVFCDQCEKLWIGVFPLSCEELHAVECDVCSQFSASVQRILSVHAPGRKPIYAIGVNPV